MKQEISVFIRKRVAVMMVILLLLSCLPVSALANEDVAAAETPSLAEMTSDAESESDNPESDTSSLMQLLGSTRSGSCGPNVNWELSNGTLTLSGTGSMDVYGPMSKAPWYSYRDEITTVDVKAGVTYIAYGSFRKCSNLVNVTLPDTISDIYIEAFESCSSLETIELTGTIPDLSNGLFWGCTSLKSVTIPRSVNAIYTSAFGQCESLTDVYFGGSPSEWDNISVSKYGNDALKTASIHCKYQDGHTGKCGNNLTWELLDGTLSITGTGSMYYYNSSYGETPWYDYRDEITAVRVGSGVTSLSREAFSDCKNLMSVDLPDSLNSVGTGAFSGCESLESITIPQGLSIISTEMFMNCSSLKNVALPVGLEYIDSRAFCGCDSLESITIPQGVTSISTEAFLNCRSLKSITLPDSVDYFSSRAFSGCESLESITIPQGVTTISTEMFLNCCNLKSITLPESVYGIYTSAFSGCDSLNAIYYNGTLEKWSSSWSYSGNDVLLIVKVYCSDGVFDPTTGSGTCGEHLTWTLKDGRLTISGTGDMNSYDPEDPVRAPWRGRNVESVVIENGVTSIGNSAFSGFSKLTDVEISDSVNRVGWCAFSSCSSLQEVVLPDTVAIVAYSAFKNCGNLVSVHLPSQLTTIERSMFQNCGALESVAIPSTVTSIESNVFSGCASLHDVEIPESVTSIENFAFSDCTSLSNTRLPGSVTTIGSCAFSNCQSMTRVEIPRSVEEIGSSAYANCTALETLILPQKELNLGSSAFKGCVKLADDNGFIIIQNILFDCLGNENDVSIPEGVTRIGGSFSNYSRIQQLTIPVSMERIDSYTLSSSKTMTDIYYSGTKEAWDCIEIKSGNSVLYDVPVHCTDGLYDPFSGVCGEHLTWVLSDGTLTISGSGKMFEEWSDSTPWRAFSNKITSVVIENGVTDVCNDAFRYCYYITDVSMADSVMHIGDYAFYNCYRMKNLKISQSAKIGDGAFYDCEGLADTNGLVIVNHILFYCTSWGESIAIPSGVTQISTRAFSWRYYLNSLTIPGSVTSIREDAFEGCDSLANVSYGSTKQNWSRIEISDGNEYLLNASIQCSDGLYDPYSGSCGASLTWTLKDGVLTISGTGDMNGANWIDGLCDRISSVVIGEGVAYVTNGAFSECLNLKAITVDHANTSYQDQNGVLLSADGTYLHTYPAGKTEAFYEVPDGVITLGSGAFCGCGNLTMLSLPTSIKNVQYGAFDDGSALTDVYYSGSEEDWSEISIGADSSPLDYAEIHFCSSGPSTSVSELRYYRTGGGFAVQSTIYTSEDAIAYFARYSSDGRFLGVESYELPAYAEETMTFFADSNVRHAKLMLLSLESDPLCACAECYLPYAASGGGGGGASGGGGSGGGGSY